MSSGRDNDFSDGQSAFKSSENCKTNMEITLWLAVAKGKQQERHTTLPSIEVHQTRAKIEGWDGVNTRALFRSDATAFYYFKR